MKKNTKPAILKTFSEFTIEELRAMPLKRVLSLFREEIKVTFTERKSLAKKAKKNATSPKKHTSNFKLITGKAWLTVKRIFSIHQKANTPLHVEQPVVVVKEKVKRSKKRSTSDQELKDETIVFSSQKDNDEPPMPSMISTQ